MCYWLPAHEADEMQTGKKLIQILKEMKDSLFENKPKQWKAGQEVEWQSNGIGGSTWIFQLNEWTYSFKKNLFDWGLHHL